MIKSISVAPQQPADPGLRTLTDQDTMPISPDAPFFIVFNAGSGHRDAVETRSTIERVFAAAGRALNLREIPRGQSPSVAARRAVDDAVREHGVVVAAGGDGTINAVAQAALGSGRPFGVIPQGTFNYFARTHGIPLETEDAAKALLTCDTHQVQAGLVNDKVFLVNASLGLYPQLLQDREAYKKRLGRSRLVALWAGLRTILGAHRRLRLRIEHRRAGHDEVQDLRTLTLFVANNRLQLEQVGIAEAPLLEQGQLAAITLKPVGTLALVGLMARGALGRLGEADTVDSFASRRITVQPSSAGRRVKVATDGEIMWLRAPLDFRVSPDALNLLKPDPVSAVAADAAAEARGQAAPKPVLAEAGP
jgi:diacylglycerol kinase family enzyme